MSDNNALKRFFEKEYGSFTALLSDLANEIEHDIASAMGIDIYNVLNHSGYIEPSAHQEIKLDDKQSSRFVTDKNNHGRAAVWIKHKIAANCGVSYPVLTLKVKGTTNTWNGWEAFKAKYEYERDIKRNQLDKNKYQQQQLQKQQQRAEREAQRKEDERLAKIAEQKAKIERQKSKDEYLKAYDVGCMVDGTDAYLKKKHIHNIAKRLPQLRTISERYDRKQKKWFADLENKPSSKKISAIPLARLGQEPVGLQRLSINGKYQTEAVNDGDFKKAFAVIGPALKNGNQIDLCEGFATTVTGYGATSNTSIFCGNADNLKALVPIFLTQFPDSKVRAICDNDQAKFKLGRGNKGMLVALELLQQYGHKKNFKVFIPKVNDVKGTDINDLHVAKGLTEVTKQLKQHQQHIKLSRFEDKFQLAQARFTCLPHVSQRQTAQIRKLAASGMALAPSKYTPDDITNQILGAAKNSGNHLNRDDVQKIVLKAAQSAMWNAQKTRSFSRKTLQGNNIIYKYFDSTVINDDVVNYINNIESGIIVLRAPMGSGKTQFAMKPLMDQMGRAGYLAHRVSLIAGATEALNSRMDQHGNKTQVDETLSVKHYKNDLNTESAPFIEKMACCVNSIINPLPDAIYQELDQLFIDEAAQTLDAVTIGGAMFAPQAVFSKLKDMMANTRRVLLCDADANDNLLTLCELANQQRDEPIHVIELKTDCSNLTVEHTDDASLTAKVLQAAQEGKKLVIATDNCAKAEELHDMLKQATGKNGILITGENRGDELPQEFETMYNAYVDQQGNKVKHKSQGVTWYEHKQLDWLIYSPAITSGVSVEVPYFDEHFGFFSGISISPSEAIQMLRRDRTARNFKLGLKTSSSNAENDPNKIISAFYKAELERNNVEFEIGDDFTTQIKTSDPDFDRMRALALANNANAKSNFANNLLWSLVADNYQVHQLKQCEQEKEQGKELIETSRDIAKAALINLISGVETPTQERLNTLESKNMVFGLSASEQAEIHRHEIEHELKLPVNEETIIAHKNGLLSKVKRAELLFTPADHLKAYDDAQKLGGIAASRLAHTEKRQQAYFTLLDLLNINTVTGKGLSTPSDTRAVFNHFIGNDELRDIHNNILKIGAPVRQSAISRAEPTKWVQAAFDKLGLKYKRSHRLTTGPNKGQWCYAICPESWDKLKGIINARQQDKNSFWPLMDAAEQGSTAQAPQTASNQNHSAQPDDVYKDVKTPVRKLKTAVNQVVTYAKEQLNIPESFVKKCLNFSTMKQIKHRTFDSQKFIDKLQWNWQWYGQHCSNFDQKYLQ